MTKVPLDEDDDDQPRDILTEVIMRGLDLERAAICAEDASCQ